MGYLVVAAWVIQAAFGVSLLVSWARRARGRDAGLVLPHILMMVGFLVPWSVFLATGAPVWAWLGFLILVSFIGFGDATMVRRSRAVTGVTTSGMGDYWPAVRVALSGRLGWRVIVHALMAPVVLLPCVAVCITATIAAG
ncbi:hypothetical protein ACH3VR_03645 [Microbacterium sp. B2969]|uniref:Uncharacterized protein n=1 Tax=Microbacterium alkaliflavum TaxID=3248839 RepID=A0ABW7Q5M2_9MICO